MNILLWILQGLLALHTIIGAVWKFFNSAQQTMASLGAIPPEAWLVMGVIELFCSLGLVLPAFNTSLGKLAPISAAIIAAEMLFFCGLHIYTGAANIGPMIYWLVVAAACAFIAYGRFKLKPF